MFEERNLDVLALSETKLKSKGKEWFGNGLGVKSWVGERTRVKEVKADVGVCERM